MYITRFTRRSWVEIDIHKLKRNLDVYRSRLPEDAEIMARLFRLAEREGVVCFMYVASDTLTAFDSIEISASGIKTPKGFLIIVIVRCIKNFKNNLL